MLLERRQEAGDLAANDIDSRDAGSGQVRRCDLIFFFFFFFTGVNASCTDIGWLVFFGFYPRHAQPLRSGPISRGLM